MSQITLNGLARQLLQDGCLADGRIRQALDQSRQKGVSLSNWLISQKLISPRQLATSISRMLGMELFDLDTIDLRQLPLDAVPGELVSRHGILPLKRVDQRLSIAIADPTQLGALEDIRLSTGMPVEPVLVEYDKLDRLLSEGIGLRGSAKLSLAAGLIEEPSLIDALLDEAGSGEGAEDIPVVRFVNRILLDAINQGASDIHFEPGEGQLRIRQRLDGMLVAVDTAPANLAHRVAARIKVMARMDIAERRLPQDGRMRLKLADGASIDMRVNSCPTLHGEKLVLRVLDTQQNLLEIRDLGFEAEQDSIYRQALHASHGMILVTGPTGSGKSLTLYAGLKLLNTPERNISAVEDPVEIHLPGINQVNINPRVGLDFATSLRAFMRQDPDVIMVGEIRDTETAEIAMKAAQTGHLVLSTLHTNDAPQTLIRLANMGVHAYNIAASVNLIIAQRLARRLCPDCRTPHALPLQTLREQGFTDAQLDEGVELFRPVGCPRCSHLGYRGRVGIYQVMPISDAMRSLILEGGSAGHLELQAGKEGIETLRLAGLRKLRGGVTSLDEINRVSQA